RFSRDWSSDVCSSDLNTEPSDHWVVDASYFRLKNVQLGYTLPRSLTDRAGLRRMRLYVGGTNLFTRSDLTEWGTDAETVTGRTEIGRASCRERVVAPR